MSSLSETCPGSRLLGRCATSKNLRRQPVSMPFVSSFFFFFSSRRRHTRLQGDWSSDVCSSDLCASSRPRRRAQPCSSSWCSICVQWQGGADSQASLSKRPRLCMAGGVCGMGAVGGMGGVGGMGAVGNCRRDRKSTRLNSSHLVISYAVFCLKKKKDVEYVIVHLGTRQ